MWINNVNSYVK